MLNFGEVSALQYCTGNFFGRAEYCFESTVSEKRTHWVLRQTRWVLRKTRWVRFGTQIIGREELTEFAPRNSMNPKKLTKFCVWNRTLRNRIRPVSDPFISRWNREHPDSLRIFVCLFLLLFGCFSTSSLVFALFGLSASDFPWPSPKELLRPFSGYSLK